MIDFAIGIAFIIIAGVILFAIGVTWAAAICDVKTNFEDDDTIP